jgi:hypothetical protein
MKIAICFSGQIRRAVDSSINILNFIEGCEVDYFIHTWDINDGKRFFGDERIDPEYTHINRVELNDYIKINRIYKPKKTKVDLYEDYCQELLKNGEAIAPMWYSWYESISLKREYEKENNFQYDVVIKMRLDCIYDPSMRLKNIIDENISSIKNDIFLVDTVTKFDDNYDRMIHDVIFMSKSDIMDKASLFYKYIISSGKERGTYHTVFDSYLKDNSILCEEFLNEMEYKWTIFRESSLGYHPLDNFRECVEINRILYNHEFQKLSDVRHIGYNLLLKFKKEIFEKTGFAPNVLKKLRTMKIAICLSGQFRTYEKCYHNILKLKNKVESDPNSTVDFFCHAWNFESESRPILDVTSNNRVTPYDDDKLNEIIKIYNPKKYLIENFEKNQRVNQDVIDIAEERYPENEGPPITWCANQFYAVMRSCELKRQYEIENNFEYDVCIRLRYDQYVPWGQVFDLIEILSTVKPNTIFSIHNRKIDVYPHFAIGDVFWFSDSLTFDKICDFYRHLPSIDISIFDESRNHLIPELVFYHYLKEIGIKNQTTLLNFQICKFRDFINLKKQLKLGGLGDNEVLFEDIVVFPGGETKVIEKTLI